MEAITPKCEFSDKIMQIQTEFKNRMQAARQEVQTKFLGLFDELKQEETRLLDKLNEIENEAIKDFELSSKTLIEITQARENTLATLKSNTTNILLKNTLDMYDKEIETIKNKSKKNLATVQLQWNTDKFEVCKLTLVPNEKVKEDLITLHTEYLKPLTVAVFPHFEETPDDIAPLRFEDLHFEDSLNINTNPSTFGNNSNSNNINQLAGGIIKPYLKKQSVTSQDILGDQPFVARRKVENQFWQCKYCTVLNPMQYSICEVCERNPSS